MAGMELTGGAYFTVAVIAFFAFAFGHMMGSRSGYESGYAKGCSDTERRAKERGEKEAEEAKKEAEFERMVSPQNTIEDAEFERKKRDKEHLDRSMENARRLLEELEAEDRANPTPQDGNRRKPGPSNMKDDVYG